MKSRIYLHRYKILVGQYAGLIHDGVQIGYQDYPGQFQEPGFDHDRIKTMYSQGEGIWLNDLKIAIRRPGPVQGVRQPKVVVGETVNYDDVYEDLVIPFDRNNQEIFVGDYVYAAVKNEVRLVKVVKLAKKVYQSSYGIILRKMTVIDEDHGQTLTINDSRSTIKQ